MPRKYAVMQVHILYVHARRECYFHSWPHLTLNPPADSSAGTSEADLSRGAADMQLLRVRPTHNWEVTGSVPTTTARRNPTSSSLGFVQYCSRSMGGGWSRDHKYVVLLYNSSQRSNIQLPAGNISQASETILTLLCACWLPWQCCCHHNNNVDDWMIEIIMIREKQQLREMTGVGLESCLELGS